MSMLPSFRSFLFSILGFWVAASVASEPLTPNQPRELFNGTDLSGWVPVYREKVDAPPTWQVMDGIIHCSGFPHGYLRTEQRFRNYRLTLQWRWMPSPPLQTPEGRPRSRNSGVLLHMQLPDEVWPRSLEAQLMENNAGDFYVIGGVEFREHSQARQSAVETAGGDEILRQRALNNRRLPKQEASSENTFSHWNTYEIICRGDTVTLWVNGVLQNRATGVSVNDGYICLQSEGAPLQFRRVKIEPLPNHP
jgi:hypothetical protein